MDILTVPSFKIKHPKHDKVWFQLRALSQSESISLIPFTESKNGDPTYLQEAFKICCLNWDGLYYREEKIIYNEENKIRVSKTKNIDLLLQYLLRETEKINAENEFERLENLNNYLKLETGEARYEIAIPDMGIEKGMPFEKIWCCKSGADCIWTHYDEEPPCEVIEGSCPMLEAQLTPLNSFYYQRYQHLDFVGRSRGMQEEPLREEAIDRHLTRYGCNTPQAYETILKIEAAIFSDRARKREKERKKDSTQENKNKHKQMNM